jgi:hypothetical protein
MAPPAGDKWCVLMLTDDFLPESLDLPRYAAIHADVDATYTRNQ